jgi:cell division protein FtsB
MYQKAQDASQKKTDTALELAKLSERRMRLSADVAHLSSPQGIETELRERYMIAKDGEQVVVVPDQTVGQGTGMGSSDVPPPLSFWQKVKGLFGL